MLFVDKATRFNWIFPIERKSQVLSIFIQFKKDVELLCNRKIRALQSDNGSEFLALKHFLADHGIAHWRSCTHIHQQMASVERRHRHIIDLRFSPLDHARLPLSVWYYAFTTVAFLYNQTTTPVLAGDSPYFRLFGQNPNLFGLKVFGCRAYLNMCPIRKNKFAPRSETHVFLGYPREYCGYLCFNSRDGKFIISKNVVFLEEDFDQNSGLSLSGLSKPKQLEKSDELCPVLCKIDYSGWVDRLMNSTFSTSPASSSLVNWSQEDGTIVCAEPSVTHRMVTRARNGISKPNPRYVCS